MTCDARNQLRNVKGFTPSQRALGKQPKNLGNMADEPTTTGDLGDHDEEFCRNLARRRDAGKAFLAANVAREVREALAAKNRPLSREFQIGEWVYFWRRDKGESDLIKSYWKGPPMIMQVEYTDDPDKLRQSVLWCVHGSTLIRTTHELLRAELPEERRQREEEDDDHGLPLSTAERVLEKLRNISGSTKFADHTGEVIGQPEDYEDEHFPMEMDTKGVDTDGQAEVTEADRQDEYHEGEQSDDGDRRAPEVSEMQAPTASEPPRPDVSAGTSQDVGSPEMERETTPDGPGPEQVEVEQKTTQTAAEKRKAEEQTAEDGDELLNAINAAKRLDGLRPLPKRPKQTDVTIADSAASSGEGDELLLLYEDADTIYLTNAAKKDSVVKARLSMDERRQLDEAKTKALQPWIENQVTSTNVEKANPTLTRLTRFLILLILCQHAWKMVAADVKSAFLQAKGIREQGVRNFSSPTKDIRRRLAKMMGLQADSDQHYVLDGVLGLHVNDFIGGGEKFEREEDLYNKHAYDGTFLDRVQKLNQSFKFGKLELSNSIVFCGMETTLSFSRDEIEVKATVVNLLEANKSLRLLKASGDVRIRINYVGSWSKLRLRVYWDASWATRSNGESQLGYMIFVIEDARVDDGQPTQLVIVDWASKKLVRTCRSSLAGEAQSAANSVDALEFAKTMLTTMLFPTMQLTGTEMLKVLGRNPCITDCKALHDAANSQAAAGNLTERRTGIEIWQINEKMREFGGVWRWTNTHQQMADGLTKLQVRQQFVEKLKRKTHALKYAATLTPGKKVSQKERAQAEKELDEAAADEANQAEDAASEDGDYHEVEKSKTEFPWVLVSLFMLLVAIAFCCGCALAATCCLKYTTEQKLMDEVRVHRDAHTMAEQRADTATTDQRVNDEMERDIKELVRTASTQSQCTYRRDLTTPRFQYLRECEQTASLSAEFEA
ncbi:unnamed protein product, partial [Prorocentrum cordatum]